MSANEMKKLFGTRDKTLVNLLQAGGKTTPLTNAVLRAKEKRGGSKAIVVVLLVCVCVGIALCDIYGRKDLNFHELKNTKHYEKALQRRFGLGVGTGIFAGILGGPLALVIVGLIVLFLMGVNKPVTYEHHKGLTAAVKTRLESRHMKQTAAKKYYTGVLAGTLLGLFPNVMLVHALKKK